MKTSPQPKPRFHFFRCLTLTLCLLFAGSSLSQAYTYAGLVFATDLWYADSLVGYWRVGDSDYGADGSLPVAIDASQNGLDGQYVGEIALGQFSQVCGDTAVGFTNESPNGERVEIPLANPDGPETLSEWTIAFWVRMDSNAADQIFVNYRGYQHTGNAFRIMRSGSRILLEGFSFYKLHSAESVTGVIQTNTWHHVMVTRYASGASTVHVDGVCELGSCAQSGRASANLPPIHIAAEDLTAANEGADYLLELGGNANALDFQLEGYIDEVSLFSVALPNAWANMLVHNWDCGSTGDDFYGISLRSANTNLNVVKGDFFQYNPWPMNGGVLSWDDDLYDPTAFREYEICPNTNCNINAIHTLGPHKFLFSLNSNSDMRNGITGTPEEIWLYTRDGWGTWGRVSNPKLTRVFPNPDIDNLDSNILSLSKVMRSDGTPCPDAQFASGNVNIDAISIHPTRGTLLISVEQNGVRLLWPYTIAGNSCYWNSLGEFDDADIIEINWRNTAPHPMSHWTARIYPGLDFDSNSEVMLGYNEDVDALHFLNNGNVLLSFGNRNGVRYLGNFYFTDGDVIEYNPTSEIIDNLPSYTARRVMAERTEFNGEDVDALSTGSRFGYLDVTNDPHSVYCAYDSLDVRAVLDVGDATDIKYSQQIILEAFAVENGEAQYDQPIPPGEIEIVSSPGVNINQVDPDYYDPDTGRNVHSYQFAGDPTAGDLGTASFQVKNLRGSDLLVIQIREANDANRDGKGLPIRYAPYGFVIRENVPEFHPETGEVIDATENIARVAGDGSADSLFVTAVGRLRGSGGVNTAGGDGCRIVEEYRGNKTLDFSVTPDNEIFDPNSGITTLVEDLTVSGIHEDGQRITLDFNGAGQNGKNGGVAALQMSYDDVGKFDIYLNDIAAQATNNDLLEDDGTGTYRLDGSGSIIFRPAKFALEVGSASNANDPDCSAGLQFGCKPTDNASVNDLLDSLPDTRASEPLTITVKALNAKGTVTQNFGKERPSANERYTVKLEHALLLPTDPDPENDNDDPDNPELTYPNSSSNYFEFIDGVATYDISWPQVGVLALTPQLAKINDVSGDPASLEDNYLGTDKAFAYSDVDNDSDTTNNTPDGPNGHVFMTPWGYQIDLAKSQIHPPSSCSSREFGYAGEVWEADFTVCALKDDQTGTDANNIATNYRGNLVAFAPSHLATPSMRGKVINRNPTVSATNPEGGIPGDDYTQNGFNSTSPPETLDETTDIYLATELDPASFQVAFDDTCARGTNEGTNNVCPSLAAGQEVGPGCAIVRVPIEISKDDPQAAQDAWFRIANTLNDAYGDEVKIYGSNLSTACNDNSLACEIQESFPVRWGRVKFENAYGPELRPLEVPWQIEYMQSFNNGTASYTAWVESENDSCGLDLSVNSLGCQPLANTTVTASAKTSAGSGKTATECKDDFDNETGLTAQMCVNMNGASQQPWSGHIRLEPPPPGCNVNARIASANTPEHLKFNWDGDAAKTPEAHNPVRATFGIYHTGVRKIYLRELY